MLAKFRGPRALRSTVAVLSGLALMLVVASAQVSAATTGDGTMTVDHSTAAGGTTGQTFIFDFTNNDSGPAFAADSQLALTIPADWTPPQTTNAAGAGYVDISGTGSCAPSGAPITGSGPWSITMTQTCAYNDHIAITYANVNVPVTTGAPHLYTFTTQTRDGVSGTLTAISAGSPTITVDTLAITFYKELCPRYTDVPANETPSGIDQTGDHWAELNTSYQTVEANPGTDIPAACSPAKGWSFELREGASGPIIQTVTTGDDGMYTVYLGLADIVWGRGDGVWVNEVVQPAAGFGALRCYQDVLNGDNQDYVSAPSGVTQTYCIAYNVSGPGISLTKTSSVTKYALGDMITYTYRVINSSNVPTGDAPFTVSDDKVSGGLPFTCGSGNLSPATGSLDNPSAGSYVTCTTTHVATQADIDAHSITNIATASYSLAGITYNSNSAAVTVTAKPTLTITASNDTMTYGGAAPAITPSYSGWVNGNTVASLTQPATCVIDAASPISAGPHTTSCSGAIDTDYNITYVPGNLTVAKAVLTVTADDTSRIYGADNPTFTASYSGWVNGDGVGVLSGAPSLTTAATTASPASLPTYTITAATGTLSAANYSFTFVNGALTVIPAASTVTVTCTPSVAYTGSALTPCTAVASDPGMTPVDVSSSLTYGANIDAGTVTVGASWSGDDNHSASSGTGSFSISKLALTIKANDKSKTYGAAVIFTGTEFSITSGSLVSSGDITGVSLTSAGAAATANVAGPPYNIVPSLATGPAVANYDITYDTGLLTVGKAALQITASDGTMGYGGPVPNITPSYGGLVAGDSAPATLPICDTTATNSSSVGTSWPSTCSGAGDPNYTITYVAGTVTVNSMPTLHITASNEPMTYGGAVPTITATIIGFVNGDGPSSLPGLACGTDATSSSPIGGSPYASHCSGAVNTNYNFDYILGTVTVGKADLTITATDQTKAFGTTLDLGTTNFTTIGLASGDSVGAVGLASTGAAVGAAIGTYEIVPSGATGVGLVGNYNIAYANGTLTVIVRHVLTVTADDQSRDYGKGNPALTYTITGYDPGDDVSVVTTNPTCTTTAKTSSLPGTYQITCSGAKADAYDFNYVAGTLKVTGAAVLPATGKPHRTPPITSASSGPINQDSTPLFALLICIAFGGLGLLAVQAQRKSMRR
jgi:uncharacterized repeat protein (TIGR01451 family)